MFTFGREHEKKCSGNYLKNSEQLPLIHSVVDAVHDLIESRITVEEFRATVWKAFTEGGAGVWEQTGGWVCKLSREFPEVAAIWKDLSSHQSWKIRWRTACFLDKLPSSLAMDIGEKLMTDKSEKVRKYAADRLSIRPT